jgi:hypothetical protein
VAFFEESRLFAPHGANHCENPQLGLRLFRTAEQHRADCHENGAVKERTLAAADKLGKLEM